MSTYNPPPPARSSSAGVILVVILAIFGVLTLAVVGCGVAGFLFFRLAQRDVQQALDEAQMEMAPPAVEAPAPPVGSPVPAPLGERAEWAYETSPEGASGALRNTGENWTETRSDGITYRFAETGRTAEYVELYDSSRGLHVRLYADRMEWGRDGQQWTRGQSGSWRASTPPAKPAPVE